jgi:hypothetical protein
MDLPHLKGSGGGQIELFGAICTQGSKTTAPRPNRRLRRARLRYDNQIALGLPELPLNPYRWTEREIFTLLERYLRRRLRLLRDERVPEARRQKVINWVAAPIVPWPLACKRPLSFQALCYVWPTDPELAREKILQRVAPDRL